MTEVYDVWPEYWDFDPKIDYFGPQIISCQIPREFTNKVPRVVSLHPYKDCTDHNEPSNMLRVINNQRLTNYTKPSIGVCVQALRFRTYDVSVRLVEWLEMVRLMGGHKVYLYAFGATESLYKVLNHYKNDVSDSIVLVSLNKILVCRVLWIGNT